MSDSIRRLTNKDLNSALDKAEHALDEIIEELQAIEAEYNAFGERGLELIVVHRPFGRLEADAILEDIDRRKNAVIARFKRQAVCVYAHYVEVRNRNAESEAQKRSRECNELLEDF